MRRIYNWLSSRRLNVILTASAAAYSVLLVIWATMSPPNIVYGIGSSLPFKIVLALYIINNLLCLLQQAKVSIAACRVVVPSMDDVIGRSHFRSSTAFRPSDRALISARQVLVRRGFRVSAEAGSGRFSVVRGRLTPIATILFHAALFLLPLGIIVGSMINVKAQMVLAEGESFRGTAAEYTLVTPKDRVDQLPPIDFRVEKVRPRFWSKTLLFTDLYADIVTPADNPTASHTVRLNVPWKPAIDTYVSLVGLGYAPRYSLEVAGEGVVEDGFVKLTTFPPGARDSFTTSAGNYTIDMAVLPDARKAGGKLVNKTLDLRRPAYDVEVTAGERKVFKGTVLTSEKIELTPSLTLSFPEIRYWGQFRVVRAGGVPFIWLGFWLATIAVIWRAFWYQKRLDILVDDEGRIIAAGKADYYKILNEQRFLDLLELAFDTPFERRVP